MQAIHKYERLKQTWIRTLNRRNPVVQVTLILAGMDHMDMCHSFQYDADLSFIYVGMNQDGKCSYDHQKKLKIIIIINFFGLVRWR